MKPTIQEIKDTLAQCEATWFHVEETGNGYQIDSREYGNIADEIPGKKDVQAGTRLAAAFRKAGAKVDFEIVDEWVQLLITYSNT